jgi:hypothetical protein
MLQSEVSSIHWENLEQSKERFGQRVILKLISGMDECTGVDKTMETLQLLYTFLY